MKDIKGTLSISDLFRTSNNYTFLIGAGASMESPSNLPSAREIVKTIVELCTPDEYIESILSLPSLKYEILIENINNISRIDPKVEFLDYFDNNISPNLIHMFIAQLVINGRGRHHIITTNFDYLIEHAFSNVLPDNEKENIIPIITKSDFSTFENIDDLYKSGKFPICKIHGSKKNIITQTNTSDSLITDITSFGKNRSEGETFAIEPFKKPLVNNLMKGQTLVVMGYSGGDDFDISPMLRELEELKQIIWIQHSSSKHPEIIPISKNQDFRLIKNKNLNSEQLVMELSDLRGYDNYIIKINTLQLVEVYLDALLLKGKLKKKSILKNQYTSNFEQWLGNNAVYKSIIIYEKYYFAGNILSDLGEMEKGLSSYKKGLLLTPKSNQKEISLFLNNIGTFYKARGEYENALKNYHEVLKIDEQLGDLQGKATALNNIGSIYYAQGDYENALNNYQEALKIDEHLGDLQGKATDLNNIGMIYKAQGDYENALTNYHEAIKIAEHLGDLHGKAARLNNIGIIYDAKGDYENALKNYNEALKIAEHLSDLQGKATRLNNIGMIYNDKGDYENALNNYHEALKIDEHLGNLKGKATDLNNIGSIYYAQGDYENALNNYHEALKIAERLGDLKGKAATLNNIGMIYDAQGDYENALTNYDEALKIANQLGDLQGKATRLNNIGSIYYTQGDYENALTNYHEVLKIAEQLGDLQGKATRLNNIGMIYKAQGDYENALTNSHEALKIAEQLGDLKGKATDLNNIGSIYYAQGDYENALTNLDRVLEIYKKINLPNYIKQTQDNIEIVKKRMRM
ncbi:tetratricopeptide repeat protein [Promethearchaeum syntrophicum]|uniref:Tetratricopeptide repeat protein n=1 Tax=Promethearchaeum syntrophicum TaxID=2594042 RepID=A0A5B9DBD1_9ARCH|nr:tetratricopeptide repeat protein [Candidatus Prometheoarchaeum syntrophicum]QEE16321.1 photosystem I assembly protein Ycf3 [Candidatus Prometheoarchaeum syntrophicum]